MNTFLDIVAKDLYKKTSGDFSNTTLVFTNKRAALFFNMALGKIVTNPIWTPQYTTISDLFRRYSTLESGDRIQLVCELHKVFNKVTGFNEPLDQFYGWGEMMLADFDDIDKHLAPADKVFALFSETHELDTADYLTDDQKKTLSRFFSNFTDAHDTKLKSQFLKLWSKFGDIYKAYREHLTRMGIAYEGMLYRDAVEHLPEPQMQTDGSHYVFVGYNLLNEVEKTLFSFFQKQGQAWFYWDFDHYYMKGHEAGKYIAQYLGHFDNELPQDHPTYDLFRNKSDMTFISAPTEDMQARYIADWLTPERIAAGPRTAIVLADEGLLETVLHCLPPAVKHVNITTGYPLQKASVTSLVQLVSTLLISRNYKLHNINAILRHPLTRYISSEANKLDEKLNEALIYYPSLDELSVDSNLKQLFEPLKEKNNSRLLCERLIWMVKTIATHPKCNDDLTTEALYRMYQILNRMQELMSEEWTMSLYQSLQGQIIRSTTIPFHGEPVMGIQIMGVLETRNLDFDHVLLLSCNEGKIPAKVNDTSFIPHSIRKGYGLTTIDNKVAIYAYYFHRLIQRAKDVHITYNTATNEGQTGEMSRFMLQLTAESGFNIRREALMGGQESDVRMPSAHEKTQEMVEKLISKSYISPSALGRYLRCPLSFFYAYISDLRDVDTSDEEEMDARSMGLIFHKAAENMYEQYKGKEVPVQYIDSLLDEPKHTSLYRFIDRAFRTELFNLPEDSPRKTPRLNGVQTINREMVLRFILNLLKYDKRHAPFTLLATEEAVYDELVVNVDGKPRKVKVGGMIDRLDQRNENGCQSVRVIDYKTGKLSSTLTLVLPSCEDIFKPECIDKHSNYFLQAMMYAWIVNNIQKQGGNEMSRHCVTPLLIYVQHADNDDYKPMLHFKDNRTNTPLNDIEDMLPEYVDGLKILIEEVLNKDIPFEPTPYSERCEQCPYKALCW